MALCKWNPDPAPFGNASGLDYVAVDVAARIAHRFGATVLAGKLPADIQAEQEKMEPREAREPFATFKISWDGGTLSGESTDGNSSTSGYRGHYWLDRIGPETIVFDLRTVPDADITRYAVRGPMCNPSLESGMISTLGPIPEHMRAVGDAYLAPYGGLESTGAVA